MNDDSLPTTHGTILAVPSSNGSGGYHWLYLVNGCQCGHHHRIQSQAEHCAQGVIARAKAEERRAAS